MRRYITMGARILLGLIFTLTGLNGFFNFMPAMAGMPEGAMNFMGALAATGYFFPLLKTFELVSGILLLFGRYVPLALLFLAPITLNILAFHLFLAPSGLPVAVLVVGLTILNGYLHFDAYRPLFATDQEIEEVHELLVHHRPHAV